MLVLENLMCGANEWGLIHWSQVEHAFHTEPRRAGSRWRDTAPLHEYGLVE